MECNQREKIMTILTINISLKTKNLQRNNVDKIHMKCYSYKVNVDEDII